MRDFDGAPSQSSQHMASAETEIRMPSRTSRNRAAHMEVELPTELARPAGSAGTCGRALRGLHGEGIDSEPTFLSLILATQLERAGSQE